MEAEATMMKQQLEAAIQQKLAAEDRVSHLDDALKECMWQLRSVREDQEDNIHKAVMKKAQEWDKLRFELEEKMADLEHKFLEKDAENRVLSKSLSERSRTISQMSDALTKAQAEASMLQVRLESSEKEKAALKYELSVAHKEVEIRNEEKALSKRAADVACKQHLEDVKKMAKLDAECQRLRNLVRKKLPGPGAVALMKLEIEGSGTEKTDARRKCVKSNVSSKDSVWQSMQGPQSEDQNEGKQKGSLSDQYNSLEEEIKILREILTQRNSELQSARLMCARTASKLSAVEEQLEALNSSQGKQRMPAFSLDTQVERSLSDSGEPSVTSVSETGNDDEVNCAESWATALIAELDQFKKGKLMPMSSSIGLEPKLGTGCLSEVEQLLSSNSSEENYSMRNNAVETCLSSSPPIKSDSKQHIFWHQKEDPLAEDRTKKNENVDQNENENEDRRMRNNAVETCLSSSPPIKSDSKQHIFWHQKEDPLAEDRTKKNENVDQNLTKESEVQNTCKLCREFQIKLDTVEGELVKKAADQRSLEKLKQKLMFMFEEGYLSNEIFDQIREDIGFGGDSHRNSSLDSSLSVLQNVDHLCMQDVTCPFLIVDSSFHRPVSELAAAIGKLVPLMKDFARDSNNENQSSARARELATDTNTVNLGTQIFDKTQRMIDALNDKSEKLMMMSDRFIKSEIDISKIMMAVSEITSDFCRIRLSEFNVSRPSGRKAPSYRTSTTASGDLDYFAVGSPISDTSKSEFSDAAARIVPTDESTQFTRKDCLLSEIIIPQEFGKSETERVTLDTQVRTEYRRFYEVLEELEHLKLVKQELETSADKERKEIDELKTEICELQQMIEGLKVENKEIQELRREICEAEQRLAGIQAQLTSVEFSKQLGEKQINDLALAKEELESRLAAYERESGNLRDELDALRKELLGKEQKNLELVAESKEMEARVKELLLNEERNLELEKECKELQEKLEQSKCQRCSISSKKEDELCRVRSLGIFIVEVSTVLLISTLCSTGARDCCCFTETC
ncbi:hypothetical protein KP509_27G007900 [Ceratopteris richardii]|nr:hypothetical protein KP509_27G007900 [Ceratopteris richardii]